MSEYQDISKLIFFFFCLYTEMYIFGANMVASFQYTTTPQYDTSSPVLYHLIFYVAVIRKNLF